MSDHYRNGYYTNIEVIDYLKDKLTPEQFEGFCLGNMLKYASRANFKGSFEADIKKAEHYAKILEAYRAPRTVALQQGHKVVIESTSPTVGAPPTFGTVRC